MTAAEYKALRQKIGTQATVAQLLGVSREVIARRETGTLITKEAAMAIRWLSKRSTLKVAED